MCPLAVVGLLDRLSMCWVYLDRKWPTRRDILFANNRCGDEINGDHLLEWQVHRQIVPRNTNAYRIVIQLSDRMYWTRCWVWASAFNAPVHSLNYRGTMCGNCCTPYRRQIANVCKEIYLFLDIRCVAFWIFKDHSRLIWPTLTDTHSRSSNERATHAHTSLLR